MGKYKTIHNFCNLKSIAFFIGHRALHCLKIERQNSRASSKDDDDVAFACVEDGGCFRVLMTSRSGPVQHTWILASQGTRRGGGHLIRCYQAPCHQGITQSDKRVQHASFPQLLLTNLSPIERDFKDVKGDIWCWFWGQVKMQVSAPLPYV